jgi:hypothetical protein
VVVVSPSVAVQAARMRAIVMRIAHQRVLVRVGALVMVFTSSDDPPVPHAS